MTQTVLVTGGAGYIGAHVVLALVGDGARVVVYDNLSTGRRDSVIGAELVVGDLADTARLRTLFADHDFAAVLHFAASVIVPESVEKPLDYYANNTANTLALLRCCEAARVNRLVFSSTAAVYGEPAGGVCDEAMAPAPINPYGASKLMSEGMLRDLAAASDFRYVALRYFNAAGADGQGRVGECTPHSTHLVKLACEAALGKRPSLTIFGTDYDTPDGTCLRDYIHVDDLAQVHLAALAHLESGGDSQVLNCGYGKSVSVRQVIDCVKAVSGVDFAVVEGERRAGDPPRLIAACARVRQVLDWTPRHDDLEEIVATALDWEQKLD